MSPSLLQDWAQLATQTVFGAAMKLLPRVPMPENPAHNVVLSNVAGPQEQLYFLGCKVDRMYPLGPTIAGAGLNITVMSFKELLECGARRRRPDNDQYEH